MKWTSLISPPPEQPTLPCSNRRSPSLRTLFPRALLLQHEKLGVDGAAAGAVEPVGEAEGEEGAEEEGEDDGVVGGHVVHSCRFGWWEKTVRGVGIAVFCGEWGRCVGVGGWCCVVCVV